MPKRLMPTRDNLRRSHGALNASENDIAGVELMLYLIRASDVIREEIYGALRRDTGLTEGKFALLMILYDISEPVPLVELSGYALQYLPRLPPIMDDAHAADRGAARCQNCGSR